MKWRSLFLYGGYKTAYIIGTAGSADTIEVSSADDDAQGSAQADSELDESNNAKRRKRINEKRKERKEKEEKKRTKRKE